MKKAHVVIIVLLVAALLVAGVLWMRDDDENGTSNNETSNSQQNGGEQEAGEGQVVTYDGTGFSPATVTVSAGDTVTFRNESSTEVWPASAVHPTHNELPGFDALSGLGEGEEYSFTFEDAGEWAYHNHLEPSQTGTVIVE